MKRGLTGNNQPLKSDAIGRGECKKGGSSSKINTSSKSRFGAINEVIYIWKQRDRRSGAGWMIDVIFCEMNYGVCVS